MKLNGLKINFLGDSITSGWGTSSKDKVFHALLKENVNLLEARNYGVGGTRLAEHISDAGNGPSFSDRFSEMDDDADLIVVFGGTNDYGHSEVDIGKFEDKTPNSFYGACHYLFSNLIKKYLGKPIVIMTPLHRVNEKNVNSKGGTLKDYVNIIREVAEYYSLPVLDLYAISGIQPEISEIKEKYMPDGLHPNDEGHAVIAYKLQRFLEQL